PITVFETPRRRTKDDHAALSLSVETLFDRYTKEGRHLPDGSLKTERYLEHLRQTGRYLAKFFGRGQLVSELTPDRIHDYVVWRTGRRVSAILALRWDDVDFEKGTIRWRAEHDKVRQTWVVPARRDLLKELRRFRAERPGIGSVLLFPHPQRRRHRGGPMTRHLAAYWLKEAFERGRIAKPKGGLWHMFRRAWATERKDLPIK